MYFSEYLRIRLDSSPNIKSASDLARALSTKERRCGRANVSLWLSGNRYPTKAYLKKIVDTLSKSKKDRNQMILDIWELEDGLN